MNNQYEIRKKKKKKGKMKVIFSIQNIFEFYNIYLLFKNEFYFGTLTKR